METENFERTDWQGKKKSQVTFSQTVVMASVIGTILVLLVLGLMKLIF